MLGVIQEQHAQRCRLFQQWKQLDFPVVQDRINSNGIAVVPVYVGIDEQGVIRKIPRDPRKLESEFVDVDFSGRETEGTAAANRIPLETAAVENWRTKNVDSAANQLGLADALITWDGSRDALIEAIKIYQKWDEALASGKQAVEPMASSGVAATELFRGQLRFRMGVANRMLFEVGGQTQAKHFVNSIANWEQALAHNPNQYIYRRRIQQYGPRLKKPYSFYDWVAEAREEIQARDEDPVQLLVEPNGAELADRARALVVEKQAANPDPDAKILTDDGSMVKVHTVVVPTEPKPGDVVAVHVNFQTVGAAKWNHETEPLKLWVEADATDPAPPKLSANLVHDLTPYTSAESQQPVSISFELEVPGDATEAIQLDGFALFNICDSQTGQCLFRRRDVAIEIPVTLK